MARRTYLPFFRMLCRKMVSYVGKHQEKIKANTGNANNEAIDAVVTACSNMITILNLYITDGS